MTALVGIYIPAYNAAAFVERAIRSVLNQTVQDFDLVIVDDASTDRTGEVVMPFLSHPRVRYVRNERNLGMSGNWNKGISLLRTPYIVKLDADDTLEPDYLEFVIPVLESDPSISYVIGDIYWVTQNGSSVRRLRYYTSNWVLDGKAFRNNLLRGLGGNGNTSCGRRECYEHLGASSHR